jgi:hypothetical protein
MIQLNRDCLLFQLPDGEAIPCAAELVAVELIGESAHLLDADLVRNAAHAVLHYFKTEQGREQVTVGEFSLMLAEVLRGFGLCVETASPDPPPEARRKAFDLREIACDSGKGFELAFFPRLRDKLRQNLEPSPQVIHFTGLRGCVKQLAGSRRWTGRCQQLSDQIVEYLRHCLSAEMSHARCALVVA